MSQSAQLISVGFIPESHWDYPTVSAVKVISLAHSKLVMLHDWLNLRKRNLIGSDTNWRQGYCIAITLQLLFVTSNLERLGLGRTWTVNLTAYHLDSDLFKAIRGCTYKIRSHKSRRKCWRLLTLCFLGTISFIEKGMEKHGEAGEHSICRRVSTLHRLTRQQRSNLTFHGIIYESTPCSWNSEKISLVSLNFTRYAREIRQKLREIFFRIPLTWSWLVVIITWVSAVSQSESSISVDFIPEVHWV